MERLYVTACLLLLGLALAPVPLLARQGGGDRPVGAPFASRSPVFAQYGMAATSHPLATQIALDVLKQGGTAVDAAIAANAAQALMEAENCGLGGDLFALVWDPATGTLHGLNASGRSPMGLSYDTLQAVLGARQHIPAYGPLTVSVPGAVDGWFMLHDRFGGLPMKDLLAPAVDYARRGFPLTPVIADGWAMSWQQFAANQADIPELDNFKHTFMPGGRTPRAGEVFTNPDLARTLEQIAEGGRAAFYSGAIADAIDAYMRRIGGYLRKADLEAHTGEWVTPVSTTYRGYDVYELPPNGQGIAALQMLNILEAYNLKAMGHNSADYLHLLIEAKKLAFADRARFYADPAFTDVPVAALVSKEYAATRRALIHMERAAQTVPAGAPQLEQGDTIYLTVADQNGMMVSLIQSNFLGMGSGLVPDGLGFPLQNRGALFSLEQGHANVYAPGKRPFHTIIPAFVTHNGQPFLSFGVMGGPMQPQGHVQILCNIIDFGMNVQEAGDAARIRHTGSSQPTGQVMTHGGTVWLERGIDPAVEAALKRRGHTIGEGPGYFGGYQAILWDTTRRVYHGASEMRKDGQAAGY